MGSMFTEKAALNHLIERQAFSIYSHSHSFRSVAGMIKVLSKVMAQSLHPKCTRNPTFTDW